MAQQPNARPAFLIDLFCRVVDNYGDIGVCWRLARHLTDQTDHHVRLWVDNLAAFQKLEPSVQNVDRQQLSDQITILHWNKVSKVREAGHIVIEAFACQISDAFLPGMTQRNSIWINLEYLSAEDWVEGCHAMPSIQSNGLRKSFFFPGFTRATGGLMREHDLLIRRNRWLSEPHLRWTQLEQLGVPTTMCNMLQNGGRQIILFNYPNAPVQALINALEQDPKPSIILQPEGSGPTITPSASAKVQQHTIPFVHQDDFDTLLWGSDLNFVRGEDSMVRALWAGNPFVWHIYPQSELAHMQKLAAWLEKSPFPTPVKALNMAWNENDLYNTEQHLKSLLQQPESWCAWQQACQNWAAHLAEQPDLAQSLLRHCTEQAGTR